MTGRIPAPLHFLTASSISGRGGSSLNLENGHKVCYMKGALDRVLKRCSNVLMDGEVVY